jgi:hypothetical protein
MCAIFSFEWQYTSKGTKKIDWRDTIYSIHKIIT